MVHRLVFLLALMLASACSSELSIENLVSEADQAIAKEQILLLRQHKFDVLESRFDPGLKDAALADTLRKMSEMVPAGEPSSVKLVGAQAAVAGNLSELNLTFEYAYTGQWLLINVATRTKGSTFTIIGFNVVPQISSLAEQNSFRIAGKSVLHYIILALGSLAFVVTIYALILCIKTKLKGRKWPWIAFIALGFGTFSINWTTGAWWLSPLSVQLLSVSAFAPYNGPWTIAVSVPLGAVLFLIKRHKLMRQYGES